jgi:hypothetical protein
MLLSAHPEMVEFARVQSGRVIGTGFISRYFEDSNESADAEIESKTLFLDEHYLGFVQ